MPLPWQSGELGAGIVPWTSSCRWNFATAQSVLQQRACADVGYSFLAPIGSLCDPKERGGLENIGPDGIDAAFFLRQYILFFFNMLDEISFV